MDGLIFICMLERNLISVKRILNGEGSMINCVTADNSPEFLHAASFPTFGSINATAVDYCDIKINRFFTFKS